MEYISTWSYVIAFIAVINGLGVVRLLTALSELLRLRNSGRIVHFPLYYLLALFQLLIHVLFWWSIVGLRTISEVNFLTCLYLIIGPTLLFFGSSLLIAETDEEHVDLRACYQKSKNDYYTFLALFWVWVVLVWPVFVGHFALTAPLSGIFFALALVLRFSTSHRLHGYLMAANCFVYASMIGLHVLKPERFTDPMPPM